VGDWLAQQGIKPEDRSGWDTSLTLTGGVAPARIAAAFPVDDQFGGLRLRSSDSIKDSAQGTRFVGGSQLLCTRMAEALGDKPPGLPGARDRRLGS
jgi:monoamine oxidase